MRSLPFVCLITLIALGVIFAREGYAQWSALPQSLPSPESELPQTSTPESVDSPTLLHVTNTLYTVAESEVEKIFNHEFFLVSDVENPEVILPLEQSKQIVPPVDVLVDPAPLWYQPSYWFGPAPWTIRYELGINGSRGENESFSMRTGGDIQRETEFWKLDSSVSYFRNTSNRLETQNNAKLDSRLDRLLGKSPWTLYFLTNLLYDKFQTFDIRLSLNTGVGYHFIDLPMWKLLGRFGAGASREFGGADDRTAQELLFGLDYDCKLSQMQRLTAKVDYYPEWADFNKYRVVSDFGWEIDLDRPENVSLKLSVQDIYDSTSNSIAPNLFNYAVLLIWSP